jgi:hypothetical protein
VGKRRVIVSAQPAGVPEICKKSLRQCEAIGGVELFVLGKNLTKDSKVVFSEGEPSSPHYWTAVVQPDKDFLQQVQLLSNYFNYYRRNTRWYYH